MENEDNMMEENQNIIQPEEVEENPVAEVVTEDEPAAAEVEPSQPDTTEEKPVPEWRRKLSIWHMISIWTRSLFSIISICFMSPQIGISSKTI